MNEKRETLKILAVVLCVILPAGVGKGNAIYDGALVGHFEFEDSDRDSPGVFSGDAKVMEDSERGVVLSLDGDGDYMDCGRDSVYNITKEITISGWVKADPHMRDVCPIVCKGGQSWTLSVDGRMGCSVLYINNIRPTEHLNGQVKISDGKWHHVAGVYDGSEMRLYVDSVLDARAESQGDLEVHSNDAVCIGIDLTRDDDPGWSAYAGLIDDVAIFGRALAPEEVNRLYNEGLPPFMAGPDFQRFGEIARQAEAAVREQEPAEAIVFLEKAVAEHEEWKLKNQANAIFNYRRIFPDLHFLLGEATKAQGRPKAEVAEHYKKAVDSDSFSSLSVPKQGPALFWLFENTPAKEYGEIVRPLIENDKDYPKRLAEKAGLLVREGKAKEAVRFLEGNLAVYARWREQHLYEDVGAEKNLPVMYCQLAQAKAESGASAKDIAETFTKVFVPSLLNCASEQATALIWLSENEHATDFRRAIASIRKSPDGKKTIPEVMRHVHDVFASENNWAKVERFLDTLFAEADYNSEWVTAAEISLGESKSDWRQRFATYLAKRPRLKLKRDCAAAEKLTAAGEHKKAVELYRDILNRCRPEDDRATIEFRLCKCLFGAEQYKEAGGRLENFIGNNRANAKNLMEEALLMNARAWLRIGDIDKAADKLLTLIVEYPESNDTPEIAFSLGRCYTFQNDLGAAKETLELLVKDYPQSTYAGRAQELIARIGEVTE